MAVLTMGTTPHAHICWREWPDDRGTRAGWSHACGGQRGCLAARLVTGVAPGVGQVLVGG